MSKETQVKAPFLLVAPFFASAQLFAQQIETQERHPLGDRPLIVLTRGEDMTPGIAENHTGLARLSTNSRHTIVPGAGHEIHLFVPSAVTQAVQDVCTSVRQRTPLPPGPERRPATLRRRAGRPPLKRHPLGGPAKLRSLDVRSLL